ncbi:MAG: M1 family aminopeptidase [Gemmatimonas sp.]
MTLREIFLFELEYRVRQPSTWVYALVLFAIPFLMMHAINGSSQFLNAPLMVMTVSAALGSAGMLVTAGIFGDASARDVQTRMHSLFYTSPIRESHYLIGRYLGALTVNAFMLLGVPVGLLLASVMPYMEAGKFGPVQIAAYVQAYCLLLLPNLIIISAFMFGAAAISRRSLATYAGGIALFVLSLVVSDFVGRVENPTLAALSSPFGISAIGAVTEVWTPVESNSRLIGWPTILLMNRAVWIVFALAILALFIRKFRFVHPAGTLKRRWWHRRVVRDDAVSSTANAPAVVTTAPPRDFTFRARMLQTMGVAFRAWREVAANRAFLVVLVGALLLVLALGWDVGEGTFGTFSWPVTHLIAGSVLGVGLAPVMALLIAIFAGELVWRERDVRIGDLAAITPIPNWVAFAGRFVALVAMLFTLQLVFVAAGALVQSLHGYHRHEFNVYVKIVLGIKFVDYLLLGALAMAVHVIVNHKYVGHMMVVLYFVANMLSGLLGVHHRMLVYGSDPGWMYSDFNGLAPFVQGLVWFKLYWAAWALLLATVASLFWVRGREAGIGNRLSIARARLNGPVVRAIGVAMVLIMSLGGFVFYNTNVVNKYRSQQDAVAERVGYEKRYRQYQNALEPSLVKASLHVEIYPSERAADIDGVLSYVNRNRVPIDTLHILPSVSVETRELRWSRSARRVVHDSTHHYSMYVLEQPLAPGDSVAMTFKVSARPQGFPNSGTPTGVTANGSYFDRSWLPAMGYSASRELADEKLRKEHGLPVRTLPPSAGDVDAREPGAGAAGVELVDVETIIGTDAQQTAVTPGKLIREWNENGRRYFHFRTEQPTSFGASIFSAAYKVREDKWGNTLVRVYYHPTHDMNVDRMIESMKASLEYYSKNFGPYQFPELRIVEFPRYASFARAHPHTIAFSEGGAFLTRVDSADVDRPFFVVAHETAHQWWGGQVVPASAAGAAMVSETLAQYSSMMVLETVFGPKMARQFYDWNMKAYFTGRTVFTNRELPLVDIVGQPYLHYFKGAVAMYTMREFIGADSVNAALRRFRNQYAGADAPPATSRALYEELERVTPDSLRPLLSDLFEHITLWRLHTDSVRVDSAGSGQFTVSLFVDVAKVRADSVGRETPIPMNDLVEIGAFADDTSTAPFYRRHHRIHDGKQVIQFSVPTKPVRAGLDPLHKMLERERHDNVVKIEPAKARKQ